MRTTIALFASGRRNGNTGQLIDRIADELQIEVVDLAGKSISPFDYEHRNRDDDFERLISRIVCFDQVIFASPVYWYGVAAPMKTFVDRLSDLLEVPDLLETGRALRGKTAYIVCTSVYDELSPHFLGMLLDTFEYMGMEYGACLHAKCDGGFRAAEHTAAVKGFIDSVRS